MQGVAAGIAILIGLLLGTLAVASDRPSSLLQMLDWTDGSQQLVAASSRPRACLVETADQSVATQIARGAVLFQSPALLGGQAARGRLSCASCHNAGRDNPHFFLGGISDMPGTADVTSSFFGVARSNGLFDPVRIPDLSQAGRISRQRSNDDLERFIRVLIVEEFSGDEPDGASLDAVSAYVRAIRSCARGLEGRVAVDLDDQLVAIRHGIAGATAMVEAEDAPAAHQLIAATRHQLGLIDERYADPQSRGIRAALSRYSLLLVTQGAAPRTTQQGAPDRVAALSRWLADFEQTVVPMLERHRSSSLYNPARLKQALDDRRP